MRRGEASRLFREAVQAKPETFMLGHLATAQRDMGDLVRAQDSVRRSLAIWPSYPYAVDQRSALEPTTAGLTVAQKLS